MSRLKRHEQKQFTRTLTIYVVIFLVIVVFIFTFGLKLLFGTALFVANLTNKKMPSPSLTKTENFIKNIDVTDIPVATNSARFTIAGEILNFDKVSFYINGEKVKELTLPYSDSFIQEIGDLKKGANDIFLSASSNGDKTSKSSPHYTITYLSDKPKLDISEPSDSVKTNKQEIKVAGSTDKEIFIKINDLPIVVDANGSFQTIVKLNDGDNKITVTATDVAGNIETKTLTVTYHNDN